VPWTGVITTDQSQHTTASHTSTNQSQRISASHASTDQSQHWAATPPVESAVQMAAKVPYLAEPSV